MKDRVEKAVAIKYDESLPAPFVLAKGRGDLARIIEEIAKRNGVEITKMPQLADSLIDLDLGSLIPEKYYEIIAELLIFVRGLKST